MSRSLRFFFVDRSSRASLSKPGAITASRNIFPSSSASSFVTFLLTPTMPPKAEDFSGKSKARILSKAALLIVHLGDYLSVISRVYYDCDIVPVLGGGPQHSGPAYVDVLYGVFERAALGYRLFEGVEVYHD